LSSLDWRSSRVENEEQGLEHWGLERQRFEELGWWSKCLKIGHWRSKGWERRLEEQGVGEKRVLEEHGY